MRDSPGARTVPGQFHEGFSINHGFPEQPMWPCGPIPANKQRWLTECTP